MISHSVLGATADPRAPMTYTVPEPTLVQRRPMRSEVQPETTAPNAAPSSSEATIASCSKFEAPRSCLI